MFSSISHAKTKNIAFLSNMENGQIRIIPTDLSEDEFKKQHPDNIVDFHNTEEMLNSSRDTAIEYLLQRAAPREFKLEPYVPPKIIPVWHGLTIFTMVALVALNVILGYNSMINVNKFETSKQWAQCIKNTPIDKQPEYCDPIFDSIDWTD